MSGDQMIYIVACATGVLASLSGIFLAASDYGSKQSFFFRLLVVLFSINMAGKAVQDFIVIFAGMLAPKSYLLPLAVVTIVTRLLILTSIVAFMRNYYRKESEVRGHSVFWKDLALYTKPQHVESVSANIGG